MQNVFQRVKDFRAIAQRLGKIRRAFRHDHEFLKIDRCIGMRAAVENIHHRHRQNACVRAAEITEKRKVGGGRGRVRAGKGNAEERVRAEIFFVRRTVERDQFFIDLRLFARIKTAQRLGDFFIYTCDRIAHAFAAVTLFIAITQLPRFVFAGAGAARHGCASKRAAFQTHIHFDGWVAARI